MSATSDSRFDAIVIGSGIGGLACACALTHSGYKVLVLERHFAAGGLTQTFSRNGFRWAVGLHYLGDLGEGGATRRVIDWLSNGELRFAPAGSVYDTVHLPGGFELQFARSQTALLAELKDRFPKCVTQNADRCVLRCSRRCRACWPSTFRSPCNADAARKGVRILAWL